MFRHFRLMGRRVGRVRTNERERSVGRRRVGLAGWRPGAACRAPWQGCLQPRRVPTRRPAHVLCAAPRGQPCAHAALQTRQARGVTHDAANGGLGAQRELRSAGPGSGQVCPPQAAATIMVQIQITIGFGVVGAGM